MASNEHATQPPSEWFRLRKRTVILFTIESLLVGMDYSLTFLTLWLYIKSLVKPEKPKVCYSIVSAAFLAASLTLSGFVGRIVDRTRDVRKTFFVMNTVVIIGNLVYSIPISPWTLGIGRLLSGFGGPLRSVIAGELARCYHPDALSKVLSAMGMSYSFGFIIGPSVNFAFKDINFHICGWRITFVNMPGIYMALLFLCVQVLSYFLVHDISKMYDLKAELTKNTLNNSLLSLYEEDETKCVEEGQKTIGNGHAGHKVNKQGKVATDLKMDSLERQEETHYGKETIAFTNQPVAPCSHLIKKDNQLTTSTFHDHAGSVDKNLTQKSSSIRLKEYFNHKLQQCKHKVSNYGSSAKMESQCSGNCDENVYRNGEKQPLLGSSRHTPSSMVVLKKLFTCFDTALLLCLAFFESYFAVSFDMWIPMLVTDTMGWSAESLSWITIGIGVACVIPCIILTFVTITDRQMYIAAMGCILSLSVMEAIFIMLSDYNTNQLLDYLAWTVFCLLYAFLVVMEEVFLVGCLAKMVNSGIQTFSDSVRLTMYRLGALIALLTSALVFQWIDIVGCVHITVIVAGFTLMVIRRESFMNPKIII